VTSAVLAGSVAVGAGLDQRGAHIPAHLSPSPVATRVTPRRNDALTVQHPELASPPPTDTDDLTTTAPPALHHVHDLTTTATTIASTSTNHHQDRSRHWHPAVPPSRATVPATGEGVGAAPC
jgi:hypothetical protein